MICSRVVLWQESSLPSALPRSKRVSESRIIIRHWSDRKAVDRSRELGRMDDEIGWRPSQAVSEGACLSFFSAT
jgi:hypothetical protein